MTALLSFATFLSFLALPVALSGLLSGSPAAPVLTLALTWGIAWLLVRHTLKADKTDAQAEVQEHEEFRQALKSGEFEQEAREKGYFELIALQRKWEQVLGRMAELQGLPAPHVIILDNSTFNASCCATSDGKGLVYCSLGLAKLLSDAELKAVLAHELAHLKHKDLAGQRYVMGTLAAAVVTAAWLIAGHTPGWPMLWQMPLVSLLLTLCVAPGLLALSRWREYRADRQACAFVGGIAPMLNAFKAVDRLECQMERASNPRVAAWSDEKLLQKLSAEKLRWLCTHPSRPRRVAALVNQQSRA